MQAAAGAGATAAAAAGSAAGAAAGTAAGSCGNGREATEAARSRRELARRDIVVGAETSSSGAVIWRVGEPGSGAARFMSFDIGEHL